MKVDLEMPRRSMSRTLNTKWKNNDNLEKIISTQQQKRENFKSGKFAPVNRADEIDDAFHGAWQGHSAND